MRKILFNLFAMLLSATYAVAQTPQSVSQLDDKEKESLWSSTYAMVMAVVLIVILIVGRKWSKKIHDKRDEMTKDEE